MFSSSFIILGSNCIIMSARRDSAPSLRWNQEHGGKPLLPSVRCAQRSRNRAHWKFFAVIKGMAFRWDPTGSLNDENCTFIKSYMGSACNQLSYNRQILFQVSSVLWLKKTARYQPCVVCSMILINFCWYRYWSWLNYSQPYVVYARVLWQSKWSYICLRWGDIN